MLKHFWSHVDSDEVAIAQVHALQIRVPILYAVLVINTMAMCITHFGIAPNPLTIYLPGLIVIGMTARAYQWYYMNLNTITAEHARRIIKTTTILSGIISVVLLAWATALYSYNSGKFSNLRGITEHGHTVLYIGITMACCVTLLMHVRVAALLTTLIVSIPFCGILLFNGTLVEWAVAINLALVTAAMIYVGTVFARDFTHLVDSRAELRLLHARQIELANTDTLTGLDNRRRFYSSLSEKVATGEPFAVMLADLDGFKQINDVYGHTVGDVVLREIAGRIACASSKNLCTARLGGDEFAVLVSGNVSPQELLHIGQGIIEVCSLPVRMDNLVVALGASIGINVVSREELKAPVARHVERADYALFHVKQTGRGRVEIFTPEHEQRIRRASLIEQALRAADLNSELSVVYQPILISRTGMLEGFEALVRWTSPSLGPVSPGEFIPIAERSDLIHAITRVVLRTAFMEASLWPSHVRLKINLSARDLSSSEQMIALVSILRKAAIDPRRLTFEITETAISDNFDEVQAAVLMIRATGASIAVDDFGIGYSSLSIIHRLNPDLIKIDRSFIKRLGDGDGAAAMIKTIIEMCRNIGSRSLAEGVEEVTQVRELVALGCDELQGYVFSRPVDSGTAACIANGAIELEGINQLRANSGNR